MEQLLNFKELHPSSGTSSYRSRERQAKYWRAEVNQVGMRETTRVCLVPHTHAVAILAPWNFKTGEKYQLNIMLKISYGI